MPVPPGLRVLNTKREGGLDKVSFEASLSIKQASAFLAQQLPAAGFTLHGGDSEPDEVDQPFTGHGYRGTFKLHDGKPCHLLGVLAVAPQP